MKLLKFIHSNMLLNALWLALFCSMCVSAYGIVGAPIDYLQGIYAKIMYIHIPSAWLTMSLFLAIALCSALYLVFKSPHFDHIAAAIAPIGLIFNFTALFTGALWGKPTWGTFWVWDARLTSMFLQLCLYMIYLLIRKSNVNQRKAADSAAFFAIFAAINIPIIKFSVYLWNTLHQKSSVITLTGPKIHAAMLWPLLSSLIFFVIIAVIGVILHLRFYTSNRRSRNAKS